MIQLELELDLPCIGQKVESKSCPGCDKCAAEEAQLDDVCAEWPILGLETAEHGKMYRIAPTE